MHTDIYATIGRKVAAMRAERRWSQGRLAELLGEKLGKRIDPTAITRTETGKRPIPSAELVAYSELFGVSLDYLVRSDDAWEDVVEQFRAAARDLGKRAVVAGMEADQADDTLKAVEGLRTAAAGEVVSFPGSGKDIAYHFLTSQLHTVLSLARLLGASEDQVRKILDGDAEPAQKALMSSPTEYAVVRFGDLLPELLPHAEFGGDDGS